MSASATFLPASASDDGDLRAMLREEEMDGWVRLGLEREPHYFSGEHLMGSSTTFIARAESGEPIGLCSVHECSVHLNGTPISAAYLGGLRVRKAFRHRPHLLRQGFQALRQSKHGLPESLCFTSVASDNHRARRILEAGLPGLPRYAPIGEMHTWVLRSRGRPKGFLRPAQTEDAEAMADFMNRQARAFQCASHIEASWLRSLDGHKGLRLQDFWLRKERGAIQACVALWDQRAFKQTRIHGFRQPLSQLRPLYNAAAVFRRSPRLPAAGEVLPACFLAFPAMPELHLDLIREGLALAATHGAEMSLLGLPANHPLSGSLRQLGHPWIYRTCIETVHWPEAPPPPLDNRLVFPEIALL
jgi:hypothetical protein